MKLLINDKEIARYLVQSLDILSVCQSVQFNESQIGEVIYHILEKKSHPKFHIEKHRDKFKQKIYRAVSKDTETWIRKIKQQIENYHNHHYPLIHRHLDYFLNHFGEDWIIQNYINSDVNYFIKTVGQQIDPNAEMIRRKNFSAVEEDCLLRNTVGNENILVEKIDKNLPFWFIDSGYTNFVEPNKKWHRLVRNHLHFNRYFDAPADRLKNISIFPKPWKTEGTKILVLEPGQFAAGIFHTDVKQWRRWIESELRKHTDRPIEFREKINKKKRTKLYDLLSNGDYYCTISINSNSAVESIWAGVPAITLDKHISNPVTVNSLDQINDLYRGPLGNWLAWLSYCQFTFDELMDGTALQIIKKYHDV